MKINYLLGERNKYITAEKCIVMTGYQKGIPKLLLDLSTPGCVSRLVAPAMDPCSPTLACTNLPKVPHISEAQIT